MMIKMTLKIQNMFGLSKNEKLNSFSVKINGQSVKVLIDSGASVNLLDKHTYDNLIPRPALKKTSVKIYPYGSENI